MVRRTIQAAPDLGVRCLTVFGFSTENWRRPAEEVSDLMGLVRAYVASDLARLKREGVKVRVLGRRQGLPADIAEIVERAEAETLGNDRFRLQVAFNYGGRADIVDAARNAFRNFTESTWLTITVVEQNGYVAGWAAREALDETISDFWIDPAFARQGLGSALLERIEKDVAEQGFEKVTLQTHSGNAEAIGFFRRHGYSIHWLSVAYNPKLDRDVPSVGLVKQFADDDDGAYGPGS